MKRRKRVEVLMKRHEANTLNSIQRREDNDQRTPEDSTKTQENKHRERGRVTINCYQRTIKASRICQMGLTYASGLWTKLNNGVCVCDRKMSPMQPIKSPPLDHSKQRTCSVLHILMRNIVSPGYK